MQQVIFESSPAYVILCLALATGLAFVLYRTVKTPWSKNWNRALFAIRATLLFVLFFLLLGPIVRQINNIYEKPLFVFINDNSVSIKETTDSVVLRTIQNQLNETKVRLEEAGYDVVTNDLEGQPVTENSYTAIQTDLNNALKTVSNRYEGRKIAGVMLASDGIYNQGVSPVYASYNFPIHTLGVGDTLERSDLAIRTIAYNKIAYQGNKFPVRVEVSFKNIKQQPVKVSLAQRSKILGQQTKTSRDNQMLTYDFEVEAAEQGLQKLDVQVQVVEGEFNTRNNSSSVFVEVVEGKKKILLVAPTPHPDIKALREVIDKNSNYEFLLHIPKVHEQAQAVLQPDKIDLVIFHQSPDLRGITRDIFQRFAKSKTSLWIVSGSQTDLRVLSQNNMPLKFEGTPREYDEVAPVINTAFSNFSLSPDVSSMLSDYPPVSVHFGKMTSALSATPLLFQQVGSVATQRPLLSVDVQQEQKIGVLLGEGIWRWRLNEFDRTEKTVAFDELFGKLIQFLSTTEDKRKFRSAPIRQEFAHTEPVTFESQVYNDIYEPVYGNTISLDIVDEKGKKHSYAYVISAGINRYQIGGLDEGVYRFKARTTIQGRDEEVKGEFAIVKRQAELQNLTADFDLLKKISANNGGKFYTASQFDKMNADFATVEAKSVIHSEESYQPLVNLKWIFAALVLLITIEWFARRYWGSY